MLEVPHVGLVFGGCAASAAVSIFGAEVVPVVFAATAPAATSTPATTAASTLAPVGVRKLSNEQQQ